MPAITDLTWTQVDEALHEITGTNMNQVIYGHNADTGATINISNTTKDYSANVSVLRFVSLLLAACRLAQEKANVNQVVGERLNAFPTPTVGAVANGFAPVTRSVVGRHELNSTTKIIGGNV